MVTDTWEENDYLNCTAAGNRIKKSDHHKHLCCVAGQYTSLSVRTAFLDMLDFFVEWQFEPVDYPLTVQVLEATADLGGVEDGPLLVEARVAHVVDVKL